MYCKRHVQRIILLSIQLNPLFHLTIWHSHWSLTNSTEIKRITLWFWTSSFWVDPTHPLPIPHHIHLLSIYSTHSPSLLHSSFIIYTKCYGKTEYVALAWIKSTCTLFQIPPRFNSVKSWTVDFRTLGPQWNN